MAQLFAKDGDEYKEVTAFTQEELDATIEKRLQRERQKYGDYDELKSQATELGEKIAALNEKNTELEKKLGVEKLNTERLTVLHKFNVPDNLAEFVTGDTIDDMTKKAEKLVENIKGSTVTIDKQPAPEKGEQPEAAKVAKKLFKGSDD